MCPFINKICVIVYIDTLAIIFVISRGFQICSDLGFEFPNAILIGQKIFLEQFEDTKNITNFKQLVEGQSKTRRKVTKNIYKVLHRKLKVDQHNPTKYRDEPRCSVLLLTHTNIVLYPF